MFYKLVDENTIEKFKNPLKVDDKHTFTNNEEILNANGYYKVVINSQPQELEENKYLISKYILQDNIIYKVWEQLEVQDGTEDLIEDEA